ncbi:M23 family metallopeptidase [Pseudanabaenaceae cyanobacterium LEGE 13415]|nr:M23 family metallopeptidase [Pseudanabaenaceae cyanobacterium LEGE 13415]
MQYRGLLLAGILSLTTIPVAQLQGLAQELGCPAPALSRLKRHTVRSGETLESIASRYSLIPATIMGLNPTVRSGKAAPGQTLLIPPYNGIRVEVPAGQSLKDLAARYRVRPDVLYEVNGCQRSPKVVFVPGVNWSPNEGSQPTLTGVSSVLSGSPLKGNAAISLGFGWYLPNGATKPVFHSGIDISANLGTPVQAIGDGTVAFAGNQGAYGNLVVINHQQGYQTRYAQLGRIDVKVGQKIKRGAIVGTVGQSGAPTTPQPHLHFEVRSNSKLGWVAEDPIAFIRR